MKIDEFSIELRTKTPEQIRKAWSTDILVLDEAHVVRSKTVLTDDEIKEFDVKEKKKGFEKRTKDLDEEGQKINYMQMRRLFLYTNAGLKIIMTATPMFDKPYELASVMSLILPSEKQINIEDFEEARLEGRQALIDYLKPRMGGTFSFVGQKKNHVKVIDEGESFEYKDKDTIRTSNLKLYNVPMGDEQMEVYEKIKEGEEGSKKEAFFSKSRQALNSIYLDPEDPSKNTRKGFEYFEDPGKPENSKLDGHVVIDPPLRTPTRYDEDGEIIIEEKRKNLEPHKFSYLHENELFEHCKPRNDNLKFKGQGSELDPCRMEVIRRMSAKNAKIIELVHNDHLYEGEGEAAYYYNKLVKSGGGIPLGMHFDLIGYDRFEGLVADISKLTKRPRYAYITGEPGSTKARNRNIRKIANHPKNIYGEYLMIVITSDVSSTGLSFLNVRKFFHGGSDFNRTGQPEGRTIRTDSHMAFPKERQRFVRRYFLSAIYPDGSVTTDQRIWEKIDKKDFNIVPVEEVLSEISTDSFFNNNNEIDIINDEKLRPKDLTTYHLHWAQKEFSIIEAKIRHFFKIKNQWSLDELKMLLGSDHNDVTILWTLTAMIERRDIIEERFGYKWTLRHAHNHFILSPYLQVATNFNGENHGTITSDILSAEYTSTIRVQFPEDFKNITQKEVQNMMAGNYTLNGSLSDFIAQWGNQNAMQKMLYLEEALLKKIPNNEITQFILRSLDATWFKDGETIFHYYDDTKPSGNEGAYQANRARLDSRKSEIRMRVYTPGSSKFRAAEPVEISRHKIIVNKLWKETEKRLFARDDIQFFLIHNISADGEIRIKLKPKNVRKKADGTIDMRTVPTGKKIDLFKPRELIGLLWIANINFAGRIDNVSRTEMIRDILKVEPNFDKSWDDSKVEFYYQWVKGGTSKQMKEILITYAKQEGLFVRR
tara:strand:+ start:1 stop:2805 length:2805 start_codon:yes stop_codon:yes gene_type:complete